MKVRAQACATNIPWRIGTKGAPATFLFVIKKSGDYYYSSLLFFLEIVVLVVLHLAFGTRQLCAK